MNNLPPPLLAKVLNYLKLTEKIKFRLVCKEWAKRINEDCKLTSILVCSHLQDKSRWYSKWMDTNEFADLRNVFPKGELRSLFVQSANQLLDNVQNLSFYYSDVITMNRLLAKFKRLERLLVYGLEWLPGWNTGQLTIDQPMLRVLEIDIMYGIRPVIVNAPALKFVKLHVFNENQKFNFSHPQSVEHLELKESFAKFDQAFEDFVNLKILVLSGKDEILKWNFSMGKNEKPIKDDLLCKMTSLKELHFFNTRLFDQLMQQKRKYKLDQLKLYLCGLNLTSVEQYDHKKRLQLFVDHFPQLADQLYFEHTIDYDEMRALLPSLPDGFMARFTKLTKVVSSNAIEDENQFCEFLMQCRSIRSLQFEIGTVSEQLLKRMLMICPYLRELKIQDSDLSLDTPEPDAFLKLLFGFKHLTKFEIDQRINLKFMKKVFRAFTDLDHFAFFFGEDQYDGYEIDYYDERPSYLLAKNDDPHGKFKLNTIFEKFRSGKAEYLGAIIVGR